LKAFNLTAWGYQDCQIDPQDGSFGGFLTKLLFRTLPDYYLTGSAYAHFPFLDPSYMKKRMMKTDPNLATKYTWTRPGPHPPSVPITTFAGVHQVLKGADFVSACDKHLFAAFEPILMTREIVGFIAPSGYTIIAYASAQQGDRSNEKNLNAMNEAEKKLNRGATSVSQFMFSGLDLTTLATYFSGKTEELIKSASFKHVGMDVTYIDIVKDVINLIPIHYISHELVRLRGFFSTLILISYLLYRLDFH
jgi:linoleate 10R-lipoxygenase